MNWIVEAAAGAVAIAIGWWMFRYSRSVMRGDYRHPEEARRVWWIAGSGTHGGDGGQVPPLIPDFDPDDRIV